ncbi:uncharacterized protein LOC131553792 isoform X2 [Onychostoma macrolepis]|uniref:uncharacterized protein LOC131553792 isoform X2 n=1 Tax=Onychostoma macrolepis TaxID=369639 RepID=UPI00272A7D42|nr:uncharacterized protein LOC131553792 isoform X2 [Onychostoma macrolepis]
MNRALLSETLIPDTITSETYSLKIAGRTITRMFSRTLLIIVCLHLLGAGIGHAETCKPVECLNCSQPLGRNTTQACPLCQSNSLNCTNDVLQNCTIKDFNVNVYTSSTKVPEGTTVTVNCTHDVPNGSISWLKDNQLQEKEIKLLLFKIKNILKTSVISCKVDSSCGNYNSTITIDVEAANNLLVLLICVGAAATLLMLFAIVMKIALKRGQAQSQARKRQRQQNLENIHSTVNTVTSYY